MKNRKEYMVAELDKKQGLYTSEFELLVPIEYDTIYRDRDVNLLFCYKKGGIQLYNLMTQKFIKTKFDSIVYNSNYCSPIACKNGKLYSYNLTTDQTQKLPFKKIASYSEDSILLVYTKNNKIQLYNLNQHSFKSNPYELIYFIDEEETNKSTVSDMINKHIGFKAYIKQIMAYKENSKIGILDRDGSILFPAQFDSIAGYSEKGAYTSDQSIKFLLLKKGLYASYYHIEKSKMMIDSITQLKIIKDDRIHYWYKRNNKWGCFDLHTQVEIEPQYDTFFTEKSIYILSINNKYQIFGNNRKYVAEEMYDTIINWFNSLYQTKIHGKYGVLDFYGNKLVDCEYDSLDMLGPPETNDGYEFAVLLMKDGKYGFNFRNFTSTATIFDDYKIGYNELLWAKYKGKWGILSRNQ